VQVNNLTVMSIMQSTKVSIVIILTPAAMLTVKPALCAYVSLKREKKMEGGEGNVRKSRNFRCIIRCRNPLLCLIESGRSGEESG